VTEACWHHNQEHHKKKKSIAKTKKISAKQAKIPTAGFSLTREQM
jgi:hypothetical protein